MWSIFTKKGIFGQKSRLLFRETSLDGDSDSKCWTTLLLFPIPNFGLPLFRPSSMTQALQISMLENVLLLH